MEKFEMASLAKRKSGSVAVGFVFTNFNNSKLTVQALESIAAAAGENAWFAAIVDNASEKGERTILEQAESRFPNVKFVYSPINTGYFPGLNIGILAMRERHPDLDFLVIGNNDLVFSPEFFDVLSRDRERLFKHPVVSPNLTTLDGVHQNPHVIAHVSRFRELVWDVYFSNFWASVLIGRLARVGRKFLERKDYQHHEQAGHIYQGYGACYILTPAFFAHFEKLWAPGFLMGEEFYLAKQLDSRGFQVFYEPSIPVTHYDHATVSKVSSRKMWEFTREYHKIYRKFISPYRAEMDNKKAYTALKLESEVKE